jgi:fission process protein 1
MGSKDPLDDIPHSRTEPRPDFSQPLPRKKLPKEIQATLDDEEKLWEALNDDTPYVL